MVEQRSWEVEAAHGALTSSDTDHSRTFDALARVGDHELDNTHPQRGGGFLDRNFHLSTRLPLGDDPLPLRMAIWAATDKEIRDAQEAWAAVEAEAVVRVEDEAVGDFSEAAVVDDLRDAESLEIDLADWEDLLREVSARLDAHPEVHGSEAAFIAQQETRWIVTSEGTRVRQPRTWIRVHVYGWSRADDGMRLRLYRWQDVADPDALPTPDELRGWADELRDDLVALRDAPAGDAYSGPVLMRGKAAGVFVHEVIGHRLEGHRQEDEDEGQTFVDKVGDQLMLESLDIVDDPTTAHAGGHDLNGHYAYDEEGVAAQRAVLVDDGVLQGFLKSRKPIEGFPTSNGHGRAQVGRQPVARMANTIVQTSDPKSTDELRRMLRDEARAQGRDYGLLVEEIGGGFTLTGRVFPNAFNVRATYAWRVYVDGRPDELVRGVDLVGTPLVALAEIAAAGDDPDVFNGFCGAESGRVPNAAVSPSLLIRRLEVQKKEKGTTRPPILRKPTEPGVL